MAWHVCRVGTPIFDVYATLCELHRMWRDRYCDIEFFAASIKLGLEKCTRPISRVRLSLFDNVVTDGGGKADQKLGLFKRRYSPLTQMSAVLRGILALSFYALRRDAAVGVDGMSWQDYEEGLLQRVPEAGAVCGNFARTDLCGGGR